MMSRRQLQARTLEVQANTIEECARELRAQVEQATGQRHHPLATTWSTRAMQLRKQASAIRAREVAA